MIKIILDNETIQCFHILIRHILQTNKLEYIEYRGDYYYNCTNTTYSAKKILDKYNDIAFCHLDVVCRNHDSCGEYDSDDDNKNKLYYKNYNRIKTNKNDVNYYYKNDIKEIDYELDEDTMDDLNINLEKMHDILEPMNTYMKESKNIIFKSTKNIIFLNNCGINRGSDHTIIKLPFVKKVNLKKEFSLHDVMTACTNLKSHKFDNNYEMYFCLNVQELNDKIIIELVFSHGS